VERKITRPYPSAGKKDQEEALGIVSKHEVAPDQVIPFDEGDFKEF
jgi:hypothetical protein